MKGLRNTTQIGGRKCNDIRCGPRRNTHAKVRAKGKQNALARPTGINSRQEKRAC